MIGIGKVWSSVTGRAAPPAAPGSTIPRDLGALRTTLLDPSSDFSDPGPSETRSANRFVPHKTATVLTTQGGRRLSARIINISRTGVAVEAEFSDLGADEIVTVGTRPVTPGRRITRGRVFLFKKPLDPKLCGPDIVL